MKVEIIKGTSKKSGKDYEALRLSCGLWSKLIFVTPFEMHYLKSQMTQNLEDDKTKDMIKEIYG